MFPMRNEVRPYAWGSRTAIPTLMGVRPTGEPQAELWMGSHPQAPSSLELADGGWVGLHEYLERDPVRSLGPQTAETYGPTLPFLLKVLAADEPLSIQVHPTLEQARTGYAAENARGIPLDAPQRIYRDTNHKPEMIVASTWFHALCGFRDPAATAELFDAIGVAALRDAASELRSHGEAAIAGVLRSFFETPDDVRAELVGWVAAGARALGERVGPWSQDARWAASLARHYPGDAGVVVSLMLNHVRLRPLEALYLPAGNLHAYLHGVGVEVMASSDNVVRGGLTVKHVDVPELLRVVDPRALPVPVVKTVRDGAFTHYTTPTREFSLSRLRLGGTVPVTLPAGDPSIVLCTRGGLVLDQDVSAGAERQELRRGRSVFVPADDPPVVVSGQGALVRVTPGR